jgi:hypothetical protein
MLDGFLGFSVSEVRLHVASRHAQAIGVNGPKNGLGNASVTSPLRWQLAGVALCLPALSARSDMTLNRGRLRFLELPKGNILNRTRSRRLASTGGLGLRGRRRGALVGCGDSSRSFLTLLHLGDSSPIVFEAGPAAGHRPAGARRLSEIPGSC